MDAVRVSCVPFTLCTLLPPLDIFKKRKTGNKRKCNQILQGIKAGGGASLKKAKAKLPLGCCSNLFPCCTRNLLALDADFPARSSDFMLFAWMGFRWSWGLLETCWQKLLTEEPVDFLSRSPQELPASSLHQLWIFWIFLPESFPFPGGAGWGPAIRTPVSADGPCPFVVGWLKARFQNIGRQGLGEGRDL